MDIAMMDSYLESLAGYICDDDKLVTYKWLSKELEVHVNVAKIILWRYLQNHKNDVLVATFMLIGNLKDGGMRVEVVKDQDLVVAKEKFVKITSEHVYSLQKTLTDVELLAGSGKGDSRYSAIKCAKSVVMSDEEMSALRWGKGQAPQVASTEKKTAQPAPSKKESPPVEETPKTSRESKQTESKSEEKVKKVSPPSKQKTNDKKGIPKKPVQSTKAGFGHLFAKAGNQQKPRATPSANDVGDRTKKDSEIASDKKASKSAIDDSPTREKAKENKDSSNVPKNSASSSNEENEPAKSDSKTVAKLEKNEKPGNSKKPMEKSAKSSKSKKSNRGTKRGRSQDSSDDKKKRKRIIEASDSSEQSANESADEDMFESSPPPPSPRRNKSPSPSPVRLEGNKRKVRKLVDKTFQDDDGYLITKKVHVYESCSDEEPEVVETKKKVEPVKPKETIKAPVKKKQSTLMSFFKKG